VCLLLIVEEKLFAAASAAVLQVRALLLLQPASPTAVLLKALMEVLRQQPRKAIKSLAPLLPATCTRR